MVRYRGACTHGVSVAAGLGSAGDRRCCVTRRRVGLAGLDHDLSISRSQPQAGDINIRSVRRLRVAWAARDRGLDANENPGSVTSTPAVDAGLAVWADWRSDVHAVDVSSGAVRWVTHIAGPAYFEQINSSPTIAGRRIFVSTGTGAVDALDRATGKQLWSTVVDDAPDTDLFSSPVVVGSTVVTASLRFSSPWR